MDARTTLGVHRPGLDPGGRIVATGDACPSQRRSETLGEACRLPDDVEGSRLSR